MAELLIKLKNLGELNIILSGTVGRFDSIGHFENVVGL